MKTFLLLLVAGLDINGCLSAVQMAGGFLDRQVQRFELPFDSPQGIEAVKLVKVAFIKRIESLPTSLISSLEEQPVYVCAKIDHQYRRLETAIPLSLLQDLHFQSFLPCSQLQMLSAQQIVLSVAVVIIQRAKVLV